jgi:hypothetical protein
MPNRSCQLADSVPYSFELTGLVIGNRERAIEDVLRSSRLVLRLHNIKNTNRRLVSSGASQAIPWRARISVYSGSLRVMITPAPNQIWLLRSEPRFDSGSPAIITNRAISDNPDV